MTKITDTTTPALLCGDAGYDPIEDRLRQNIRATIEALFEEELAAFIGRCRYDHSDSSRLTHRCHTLETGSDSYRFKASSEIAKKKRKETAALTPS